MAWIIDFRCIFGQTAREHRIKLCGVAWAQVHLIKPHANIFFNFLILVLVMMASDWMDLDFSKGGCCSSTPNLEDRNQTFLFPWPVTHVIPIKHEVSVMDLNADLVLQNCVFLSCSLGR